jgi:hypothetical protein
LYGLKANCGQPLARGFPLLLIVSRFAARDCRQRIAFGNALGWHKTKCRGPGG